MKKRNMLALIVLCALTLLMATGCEKKADDITVKQEPQATNTASDASAQKEDVVELTFINWGDSEEQKMFEDIFARFHEANPGIRVKYIFVPQTEYVTKLNAMAATNSLPDMGQMIENSSLKWAENGKFLDVSDLYASGAISPRLDSVTFNPTKSGNFFGASYICEVLTLFYNKDMTDAAGVTVPTTVEDAWTWDEFVEAAKKLTVDQNGKHPGEEGFDPGRISVYGVSDVDAMVMAWSNGGGLFDEECTEIWLDKPETIEAFQRVSDLMNVHYVSPKPASRGSIGGGNNPLLTKKVAMSMAPQYQLLWYGDAIEKGQLNLGVGMLPVMKTPATKTFGPAVVIFEGTKHPEECKKLLEFMYNSENIVGNIRKGLWMPSEKKYYQDEALIDEWITKSTIHPQEYKTAVVPLVLDYAIPDPFYKLPNTNDINSIVTPLLDQIWSGKKTAETVILDEVMPKLGPFMEKYWNSLKPEGQ